jgi:hypothetical protein
MAQGSSEANKEMMASNTATPGMPSAIALNGNATGRTATGSIGSDWQIKCRPLHEIAYCRMLGGQPYPTTPIPG